MTNTPCQDPANDPDDWFIEKDGRQYVDEAILTEDEVVRELQLRTGTRLEGETIEEYGLRVVQELTDERVRENLRKRRHAKDKCHFECPVRTQCLQLGLGAGPEFVVQPHGIWGGYYPEELRAIQRAGRLRQHGFGE